METFQKNPVVLLAMQCEMNEEDYRKMIKAYHRTNPLARISKVLWIVMGIFAVVTFLSDVILWGDWSLFFYALGMVVLCGLAISVRKLQQAAIFQRNRKAGVFDSRWNAYFDADRVVSERGENRGVFPWQNLTRMVEDRDVVGLVFGNESVVVIPARMIDAPAYAYLRSLVLDRCGAKKIKVRHVFQPTGRLIPPEAVEIPVPSVPEVSGETGGAAANNEVRFTMEYPMLERVVQLRAAGVFVTGICILIALIGAGSVGIGESVGFFLAMLGMMLLLVSVILLWYRNRVRKMLKQKGICRVEVQEEGIRFCWVGSNRFLRWEDCERIEMKQGILIRHRGAELDFIPATVLSEECIAFLKEKCPAVPSRKNKQANIR